MSTRIGLAMVMVVLGGCREQQMARVVDVDMAPGTSQGPGVSADGGSGPIATALSAQLATAGLDVNNLPALEDVPLANIMPVMEAFATALGAQCSDCHAADKATDTPQKRIATKMWDDFVRQLARPDGSAVFCDSCHEGKITFLDRSNEQALSAYMQTNFVDGLRRKDGTQQQCSSCHGTPFDPTFLDGWAAASDGGTTDGGANDGGTTSVDAGTTSDAATAPSACALSVNEVQTGSSKSASDEFVEIYNSCTTATALTGYRLVYRSGAGTSDTLLVKLDGQSVPAGGYLVIGNASYTGTSAITYTPGLASGAGGVALKDGSGDVVDSVAWGTATNAFVEGSPAAAPADGQSIARRPDGSHAHASQALDLVAGTPTPGAAN